MSLREGDDAVLERIQQNLARVAVGVDGFVDRFHLAIGQQERRPRGRAVSQFDVEGVGDLGVGICEQLELESF